MPPRGVKKGTKRARQYERIKESQKDQGRSESRAEEIAARAASWADELRRAGVAAEAIETTSTIGGGSLPGETLPTRALAIEHAALDELAGRLRRGRPPVVARIERDRLLFDPRTVLPEEDAALVAAVTRAAKST